MNYERLTDPDRLRAVLKAVLLLDSDIDLGILLDHVVAQGCELAGAHRGALGLLDPIGQQVEHFVRVGLTDAETQEIAALAKVASDDRRADHVEVSLHPWVFEMATRHCGRRSVLAAPIHVGSRLIGHLYLTDKSVSDEFSDADLDAVDTLAEAAGIAISSPRWQTRDTEAGGDREKIARELHDTVIQRLYGIGVALQGSLRLTEDDRLRSRMQRAIDDLDDTVAHVRATIVELGNLPL